MKFIDYIKGDRRGREANELEREALHDSFLADAIEGYDRVSHINHFDRLMDLRLDILHRAEQHKHRRLYRSIWGAVGIAATIGVAFGVWTILPQSRSDNDIMQEHLLSELQHSAPTVGTPEELLAEARRGASYCDVEQYGSTEEFLATIDDRQSKINNQQQTIDNTPAAVTEAVQQDAPSDQNENTQLSASTTRHSTVNSLDTIANPAFLNYFRSHRREATGSIVLEFRVGDSGRASKIHVLSAPTQEAGREAIDLLISGPGWESTDGNRIRTILSARD